MEEKGNGTDQYSVDLKVLKAREEYLARQNCFKYLTPKTVL